MYSTRLYKYRDSYVLYIPTVHTFRLVLLTHSFKFWYRHTDRTFPPSGKNKIPVYETWFLSRIEYSVLIIDRIHVII